ncbi:DUF1513 domain-containing protein [Stappia sp. F7233]|uniref:DUF1513 domain-containing protein n=1 Tax=Stappia albiluteola TaxID=2758565 RepID=A0A839AAX4_9HYPH|nr:DUF1513 domain-containing protein [Stappia albiluteola]MBA5775879.1 DUF1513 domain-containing protein [Stappia albiluteola]
MLSTEIDRRHFLTMLAAGSAGLVLSGRQAAALGVFDAAAGEPLFAGARREADGSHSIAVVTPEGLEALKIPLPGRGHDIAFSPDGRQAIAFARRPGTFAVAFDVEGRREPVVVSAPTGRHFYGHGVYSPDGRLVYATENDFASARGLLGVYDVSGETPRRIGEIATGGVGPHDVLLSADGRTLVVANGGIETRPETGREKLNLATMEPNVTFIDRENGAILASHKLDKALHQLSLRHMALDPSGTVWIGGQYEGPEGDRPPLLVRLSRDVGPALFSAPDPVQALLANYVGSVAVNASGDVVATSHPRGNRILYWSTADGSFLGAQIMVDACGLAPIEETGFLISDGNGQLSYSDDPASSPDALSVAAGISWDNHLVPLKRA